MVRAGARADRGLRCGVICLATVFALASLADDAHARGRHRGHQSSSVESYNPSTAAIVVDANSGAVMVASNADSPRHPASLTKIMTLYLLFERLDQGKIKLTSDIPVSAHASAQAPSKLELKPGDTIKVETAIRAIVTKSANDVAVAIGEALGGDEPSFAQMMTAKARALGMNGTTYRNASGLPEDQQITTARDQATLARALQDRFPTYYKYFATRTFEWRGKSMRNHNHLLGEVEGVDGIKTGYIHDSGFNIVTSVRRNGRHIIAVVFGGRTANARDARVISLINNNINVAAAKRTAPPLVEGSEFAAKEKAKDSKEAKGEFVVASAPAPHPAANEVVLTPREARPEAAQATPPVTEIAAPSAVSAYAPEPGSTNPIRPNAVKTLIVHPGTVHVASLTPMPSDSRKIVPGSVNAAKVTTVTTVKSEPPPQPKLDTKAETIGTITAKIAAPVSPAMANDTVAKPRNGGWMIQVGAFPVEKEAKERLSTCQSKAKQLSKADPFTEKTVKGDKPLYRARFAGLEKEQAEAACKTLKNSDIPCMLVKN